LRTVITGSGSVLIIIIAVLIHCAIVGNNMRDIEVANSLETASDYAIDVMSDIYAHTDYYGGNKTAYMQQLMAAFCTAVNERIGTDGDISVKLIKADLDSGEFDIIVTENYDYPLKGKKGVTSCERAVRFESD
jgi:hypothetical protein